MWPFQRLSIEWAEPGLNRRHMDFQSIALPAELSAPVVLFTRARGNLKGLEGICKTEQLAAGRLRFRGGFCETASGDVEAYSCDRDSAGVTGTSSIAV